MIDYNNQRFYIQQGHFFPREIRSLTVTFSGDYFNPSNNHLIYGNTVD